ncbi:Pol polyprotein [Plakobranchus ocellatus]|uniref:Pol polyprotein n=1 Tax=Plakobranchus ocellatus TaxID=259542 RepID=A0AAV4C2E8_9GAST|nr:Pol polyprotein [Plakobranchus ocellatus]
MKFSDQECEIVTEEIQNLVNKGIISECEHARGEVISTVFIRQKKDGMWRLILNLKRLNTEVTYRHFKMPNLCSALKLVKKDAFMASIDLKDAYFSVSMHNAYKKFFRFKWRDKLFEFNVLPNGLALAPRLFTKLLKPLFASLRKKGHISTFFIDDLLLIGHTELECVRNVCDTISLFSRTGFVVHPEKSMCEPSKVIQYLGVIINSDSMTLKPTEKRANSLVDTCSELLQGRQRTIRDVAVVVGKMVSSFPAIKYGPLYYRHLDRDKNVALNRNRGNFDALMTLSDRSRYELQWWVTNIFSAHNDITPPEPDVVVFTDASLSGWGCSVGNISSGGHWPQHAQSYHINILEIRAVHETLKCFCHEFQNKHVRVISDNTTAIACINHMGTNHSVENNEETWKLWTWCIHQKIWISAAHVPEGDGRLCHRNVGGAGLADTDVVPFGSPAFMQTTHPPSLQEGPPSPPRLTRNDSSTAFAEETGPAGLQSLGSRFEATGLNDDAIHLVMNSWRPNTAKSYTT